MEHKLKKSLPFAKVGVEVIIRGLDAYIEGECLGDPKRVNVWIGNRAKLIENGWIEEVKPREFYVREDHIFTISDIEIGHWDKSKFIKVQSLE